MKPLTTREKNIIAKNIRRYREKLFPGKDGGKRLAELTGATPSLLSRWAKGTSIPAPDRLFRLASAFGISVQVLCGRPKPRSLAVPRGVPHQTLGQVATVDLLILVLTHVRKAMVGKVDTREFAQNLDVIKRLLEKEL